MTGFYWCEATCYDKDTTVLFHWHFLFYENISVFFISDVIFFPYQMSRKQAVIMQVRIQCTRVQGTCSMTDWYWQMLAECCTCINTAFTCSTPPTVISVLRFIYPVIFYILYFQPIQRRYCIKWRKCWGLMLWLNLPQSFSYCLLIPSALVKFMGNFPIYFINTEFVLKLYSLEASDLIIYSLCFETSIFITALCAVVHCKPLGGLVVINIIY